MYHYETHLHTQESSACGYTSGADYPAYYRAMGYDGIIITDHFYHGNTRADRQLPWEEFVNAFCAGYEAAKAAGDAIGFPVFFGLEENFEGDEFLIYGIDKAWLLAHPDMLNWDRSTLYDAVHAAGGLMVQAHPFRERGYLSAVHLDPENCDAWEGYNSFNDDDMNWRAVQYASDRNIFLTAGSDLHNYKDRNAQTLFGMSFQTPLRDIHDYVSRILAREGVPRVEESRQKPDGLTVEIKTTLPLILHHR